MAGQFKKATTYDIHKIYCLLLIVIPVGVIGNIVFSFFATDIHAFAELSHISVQFFLIATILAFAPWVTNLLRLRAWTVFLGKKYRMVDLVKIILGQELGAAITPTLIGGNYVKAGMLMKLGLDSGRSVSVMFLSGLEDAVFLVLFAPFAIALVLTRNPDVVSKLHENIQNPLLTAIFIGTFFLLSLLIYRYFFKKRINNDPENKSLISGFKKSFSEFTFNLISVYKLIWKRGKTRFLLCILFIRPWVGSADLL